MAGVIDKAFGIHAEAVGLRARRAEVLATNLANADTPGFKAKDVDFRAEIERLQNNDQFRGTLTTTHSAHIALSDGATGGIETLYRNPLQRSLDGNTVEGQVEQAEYMRNALQMQASLRLLDGRIKGLMTAIRGE